MDAAAPMEDGPGPENHPKILANETPTVITELFSNVIVFVQQYGWFLVAAVVLAIYIKSKLEPQLQARRKRQEDMSYLSVDPETARQRQEAMEAARRRMQEEHDAKAARVMEEQQKREEKKRLERIEDWDRHQKGGGYRSRIKKQEEAPVPSGSQPKPKKTTYRSNDYNPLTGMSSGSTFRPPRRGGGGGGG